VYLGELHVTWVVALHYKCLTTTVQLFTGTCTKSVNDTVPDAPFSLPILHPVHILLLLFNQISLISEFVQKTHYEKD